MLSGARWRDRRLGRVWPSSPRCDATQQICRVPAHAYQQYLQRVVHPLDHFAQCLDHHRSRPVVETGRPVISAGLLRQNPADLLAGPTKPAPDQGLAEFARNAQKMTAIAVAHINKAIQACKRARAHTLPTFRRLTGAVYRQRTPLFGSSSSGSGMQSANEMSIPGMREWL